MIKTKIPHKSSWISFAMTWVMAFATLIGSSDIERRVPVLVSTSSTGNIGQATFNQTWARNDTENETVHMPSKFDVGLRMPGITGRM